MKAVIQRVNKASVSVANRLTSSIEHGYLVLLGISIGDTPEDVKWLAKKIAELRIFADTNGIMNKSIQDVKGEVIVVSQFTLYAKTKKGNRPSYVQAAKSKEAIPLYKKFIIYLSSLLGKKVLSGEFGQNMEVSLLNDGPVTIIIDTNSKE